MVAAEGGHFKEQLWRTIRTIALAFLLISGVGALIEDRGISKGITYSDTLVPFVSNSYILEFMKDLFVVSILQGWV